MVSYKVTAQWQFGNAPPQKLEFGYTESGTGFIYRPDGYAVTNGHVVWHANMKDSQAQADLQNGIKRSVLIGKIFPMFERELNRPLTDAEKYKLMQLIKLSYTTPDLRVYLSNRKSYVAEIKTSSDPIDHGGKDVAVVKIDATNLPTVRLGNSDNVRLQEPIVVIGYPGVASPLNFDALSMESVMVPTVTNGHVSALKVDYKGTPVIQSDAAITHGNSGGPAFNEAGEVIGIATFGNVKETAGFNFFVPINTGLEFVRQSGTRPESGLFNSIWSDALETYDAGKCGTAREKFQDVLRVIPGQPDATRLSAAAADCYNRMSWFQRMMETSAWLLYAAAGLVILGGGGLVLKQRKSSTPVAAAARAGAVQSAGRAQVAMPAELSPAQAGNYGSIQVTAGSLQGRKFKVTREGLLIGRDPVKCQIVVNEDTVSKEHAWIVPVDQGVVLIDRGSANGTFVNSTESARVSKIGLQNGDRVFIGKQGAAVLTYYSS
jgi:serine protease Do